MHMRVSVHAPHQGSPKQHWASLQAVPASVWLCPVSFLQVQVATWFMNFMTCTWVVTSSWKNIALYYLLPTSSHFLYLICRFCVWPLCRVFAFAVPSAWCAFPYIPHDCLSPSLRFPLRRAPEISSCNHPPLGSFASVSSCFALLSSSVHPLTHTWLVCRLPSPLEY